MTDVLFSTHEFVLTLPPGFVDRSIHILEWALDAGRKVVLVVQRDNARTGTLSDFVSRETASFPRQYEGYWPEAATEPDVDDSVVRRTFRWNQGAEVMFNHVVFFAAPRLRLVLVGTGRAEDREQVTGIVESALADLRVREV